MDYESSDAADGMDDANMNMNADQSTEFHNTLPHSSELNLTEEETQIIRTNPLVKLVYDRFAQSIPVYKAQLRESDNSLEEASRHLEEILLSITQTTDNQPSKEYENMFQAVKRERDELEANQQRLLEELQSLKRTAGRAIAAIVSTPDYCQPVSMPEEEPESPGDLFGDISSLLQAMSRKMQIDAKGVEIEAPLVLDFLMNLKQQKEQELEASKTQLQTLKKDIQQMEKQVAQYKSKKAASSSPQDFKSSKILDSRYMKELENTYFRTRTNNTQSSLQAFTQTLSTFKQSSTSSFKPLMKFPYYSRGSQGDNSRISQIQFDKDEQYFAVGGYLNEIQIFSNEFLHGSDMDDNTLSTHPQPIPLQTLSTSSYITDVAWSNHSRGQISSTEFTGDITLWDALSASRLVTFSEHTAQVWSLDYSHTEPGVLASASEDKTVRLWNVLQPKAVGVIPSGVELCCVKFNPMNEYQIVFGGANYMAYCYDTRKLDKPLALMVDHKSTVSGVSFHSRNEVVTQSIDGTLKLWDLNNCTKPVRTYEGHVHAKMFAGLATKRDHIACGSENNSVYLYNLMMSSPIVKYAFDDHSTVGVVSALNWNKHGDILLAGNDLGEIQILKLVTE